MHASLSTTKDVGAHRGTGDYDVLRGTIDSQDLFSLDIFDASDNDKGFDECVYNTEEDPDTLDSLDDDLQGTSSTKPITHPLGN
ncbi:hypothetical protein NDU88_012907 [Pleurodeles waltl]|uniref:Uncharacterized protein n=1 Tax=Pleurodeles waltl TaxID=8319 RepID=A0AAV7R7A7_PLEWA|nr:hypothetical protein NDU88_012907 [Pleurodeles waltl]